MLNILSRKMKPLRIRYSISIIFASLVVLYISGTVLINQSKNNIHNGDFSAVTIDEDQQFSINSNYLKAVSAFNNKEFGIALEELNEEIRKYPNHAQAYFLLGKIYEDTDFLGKKYYLKMLSNYEKYIALKPKGKRIGHVKLRVAQYYIREGLTQENVEYLNKAEILLGSLDQNDSDVRMALGAIYLDKQDYDQAISVFEKSANLEPSELKLKYNSLGLAYIKKREYAKAERILEIAIKIDPKDKYARNNLGFVYAQQGKLKEAKNRFAEALELDPEYKKAEKNLRWVEEEISKWQNKKE
jgi:tetratricopeptide (TPR) repeat protein